MLLVTVLHEHEMPASYKITIGKIISLGNSGLQLIVT